MARLHLAVLKLGAIAMLELQRIRFAGWALTGGQHRPKAGKKKKTQVVFELKGRFALQAGHASPVKWCWCLKEKVLLGKWSVIAM